jgi:hypothetical protein
VVDVLPSVWRARRRHSHAANCCNRGDGESVCEAGCAAVCALLLLLMLLCDRDTYRLRKSTQNARRGFKYRLDTYIYHVAPHFFSAPRRFMTDAARNQARAELKEVSKLLAARPR